MSPVSPRSRIGKTLAILVVLMRGEALTVEDILARGLAVSDSSARRYLRFLEIIPGVIKNDGWPASWRFVTRAEIGQCEEAARAARDLFRAGWTIEDIGRLFGEPADKAEARLRAALTGAGR